MTSKEWYFVKAGTRDRQGPYSHEQIALRIQSGELIETDSVFKKGMKEWALLKTLQDEFSSSTLSALEAAPRVSLPIRYEDKVPLWVLVLLFIFGTIVFLGGPVFIFGVIAVVLYLIFITLLGLWSTWRRLVVADGNSVSKSTRICGATVSSWREPLRNFEGIEYAMKVIKADSKRERRIDHRIVLRHPEKKRCAILLARELREVEEQAEIRLLCRSYATALNVPELRRVAGVDATRAVGELGKPVWELVAEGKVKTEFDPRAALPRRIHLQKSEDQHAFLIDPRPSVIRVFWIFRSVLLAVVVLIVWLMVTADREFLLPGLSLTFFIGLFFLLHGVATRKERSQQALVLRRQSISLGYVEKNKSLVEERKLEPKSIEILDTSIKGRLKFNLAEGKEVRSRRLGAEAGRWLCQYLLWLYGTKWYASAGGK